MSRTKILSESILFRSIAIWLEPYIGHFCPISGSQSQLPNRYDVSCGDWLNTVSPIGDAPFVWVGESVRSKSACAEERTAFEG